MYGKLKTAFYYKEVKMNYKRILAVGLAASMVMGSSVVAFAA